MSKRLLMALTAVAFIAISVYLGVRAADDSAFVIWFGLATAVLAPAAYQLLALALASGDAQLLRQLSAVPQIEELMEQAQTQQEKVQVLEEERARLEDVIRFEARREALRAHRERLVADAARLLADFDSVEREGDDLDQAIGASPALPEIEALRKRLAAHRRGDLVFSFRGRDYVVDPSVLASLPGLPRGLVVALMQTLIRLQTKLRSRQQRP